VARYEEFLTQMPSIEGKRIVPLVTQQLRYPLVGGNKAVRVMTGACKAKGVEVKGSLIINWSNPAREVSISEGVKRLLGLFG